MRFTLAALLLLGSAVSPNVVLAIPSGVTQGFVQTSRRAPATKPVATNVKVLPIKATSTLPYNVQNPASTPAFILPDLPLLLPVANVATYLPATSAALTSSLYITATQLLQSAQPLNINGLLTTIQQVVPNLSCILFGPCSQPSQSTIDKLVQTYGAKDCLDSSTNDTVINSLLNYGGANTTVYLCPGATIPLNSPVYFTAANQGLTTRGDPTDSTRATIVVMGNQQSSAIYGANAGLDGVKVTNIQINGNRPNLGYMSSGQALIEMGGTTTGQYIANIRAYEPRGWSCLHLIEGSNNACYGAKVINSQIGPSGHAPSGSAQFRAARERRRNKRDSTGSYPPGQWADGISLACSGSTVTGNTITDATDGAIVVFQAPGSTVSGNTIIADDRQLLGGINAVDFPPHNGNFTGTTITNNKFDSKNSMIKIGLAIGVLSWQTYNVSIARTYNGVFSNNVFTSSGAGYFGYGITVAGHNASTVQGNNFVAANFGGTPGAACDPGAPAFGPMWRNPYTTPNTVAQSLLTNAGAFDFCICNGPGNKTITGFTGS